MLNSVMVSVLSGHCLPLLFTSLTKVAGPWSKSTTPLLLLPPPRRPSHVDLAGLACANQALIEFICRRKGLRWRRIQSLFSRPDRGCTHGLLHLRSRNIRMLRKMDRAQLWHHVFRQHWIGYVNRFSM